MQSLGNRAVPSLPAAGRAQTFTLEGLPDSLGMDRIKKRPQRRRLAVYWKAGGKRKRKLLLREYPYALMGARTDLCGACRATRIPTATGS